MIDLDIFEEVSNYGARKPWRRRQSRSHFRAVRLRLAPFGSHEYTATGMADHGSFVTIHERKRWCHKALVTRWGMRQAKRRQRKVG